MKNERKEELKDEMKNRISLALKDPILQQGFEIICKENAELKEGLAVGSTFNKGLNSQNKVLKEERDKYRNMVFDKDDQLTKAKEIIKKLIEAIHIWDCKNLEQVEAEAEQFLKDSEVEK